VISETHFVADDSTDVESEFLGNTVSHTSRGNPTRLRMPDLAVDSTPHVKQDLGQLSCFATSGLTSDDDDLIGRDGSGDVVANSRDRQIRIRN
jgi:hypothetical protein